MTFKEVWNKLKSEYGASSVATVERLKPKLNSIKLGDERDLLSHVTVLKELLKTSEAYNLSMTDSKKVKLFLKSISGVNSLKDFYKYVGTSTTLDEVLKAILNFIKYRSMFKTDLTVKTGMSQEL